MEITGGTDVDWLIERKGGFIILESKLFREEHITIPVGQMIAFERLYERLSSSGKCYFYLFANEDKIDLKPKLQRSPSKISKKEKAYSIKEIQKTYPKAYVRWTESDDELLKKFWKENKQSKNDKILLLMLKFGS